MPLTERLTAVSSRIASVDVVRVRGEPGAKQRGAVRHAIGDGRWFSQLKEQRRDWWLSYL